MDLQAIAGLLTPVGTFLGVLGGGVAWLVTRSDKRRESREASVIETLKERISELKAEKRAQSEQHAAEIRRLQRKIHLLRRTAGKWREQLIEHDIEPDPADWPEDPDEQ